MRRKPFVLSDGKGWLIYDYVEGGYSTYRRDRDGAPLAFSSRDAAREFLGLAPGRRGHELGEKLSDGSGPSVSGGS